MNGICGQNSFGHIPCAKEAVPLKVTDQEAIASLSKHCPSLVAANEENGLCCNSDQINDLTSTTLLLFGNFIRRCPSCYVNYANLFCNLLCSPKQSDYVKVMKTATDEDTNQQIVSVIDYFVDQSTADNWYKSCQNVTKDGRRQLIHICHPWKVEQCSPKRALQYLGSDLDHNGHFPYMVDFMLSSDDVVRFENQEFKPFKFEATTCDKSDQACGC